MSKNDRKTSKSEFDAAIKKVEKRMARDNSAVTRYVKSVNPDFVNDDRVKNIIAWAQGTVVETLPFADGSNQFKVEIARGFLNALEGGDDLVRISRQPFTAPSYNLHPRRRSHDPN